MLLLSSRNVCFKFTGTKVVFNLLVASQTEYDIKTSKVLQAEKKDVRKFLLVPHISVVLIV